MTRSTTVAVGVGALLVTLGLVAAVTSGPDPGEDAMSRLSRRRAQFVPRDWASRPKTSAAAMQEYGERHPKFEQRWEQEVLAAVTDPRVRVGALLARLRMRGLQPKLVFTWRSLATQDVLLEERRTKVSFSLHNAVDETGQPRSLAADIVDRRYGWGDNVHGSAKTEGARVFFQALGEEAHRLGIWWGGDWRKGQGFWGRYGMGWDVAHVQGVPNGSLGQVRQDSVHLLLGRGRVRRGSGGYVYRQFGNGYVQVIDGPALKGQLILPRGSSQAWQAITTEIGRAA